MPLTMCTDKETLDEARYLENVMTTKEKARSNEAEDMLLTVKNTE